MTPGLHQRVLYEIAGELHIAAERDREGSEIGNGFDKFLTRLAVASWFARRGTVCVLAA